MNQVVQILMSETCFPDAARMYSAGPKEVRLRLS